VASFCDYGSPEAGMDGRPMRLRVMRQNLLRLTMYEDLQVHAPVVPLCPWCLRPLSGPYLFRRGFLVCYKCGQVVFVQVIVSDTDLRWFSSVVGLLWN
jgi:hypothetical protein